MRSMKITRAQSSWLANLSVAAKMSYSVPVNAIMIVSFGIFLFYMLGIHNTLLYLKGNRCQMTYMYEFPQFVEIPLPRHIEDLNRNYGLYGYAEGGLTENLRHMKFYGIPVLFVPGSGGSYKQGRSLASISLRKSLKMRNAINFDYFMLDFNEDPSALYGGHLEDEAKFLRECIIKILSLYEENKYKPKSVILIGHSVGGLVAKSVFLDSSFPKESVQLIISLAAPLKAPVLLADKYITKFYDDVQMYWKNNKDVDHTTLISIGGGKKDLLVRSDLTYDDSGHINVLTTAIPGVWCSTDHLNIVWCKQLILTIVRSLFNAIDPETKQLIADHKLRHEIFSYYFVKRTDVGNFQINQHPRFVTFNKEFLWYENLLRQFSIVDLNGTKVNSYIMFRLGRNSGHQNVVIETSNINTKDWIFVCKANVSRTNMKICEQGENLSNMTEVSPTVPGTLLDKKFMYLHLPTYRSKNFSHIVINVPKTNSFTQVNIDMHDAKNRTINYNVPSMFSTEKEIIIEKTDKNAIYYKINLLNFETIWQGFLFGVETISCKTNKNNAVISFMIPWAAQHNHFYINDKTPIFARLTLASSRDDYSNETMFPYVKLSLEPTCTYKVTIQPSLKALSSQTVIYFTDFIPAYMITVLFLVLSEQVPYIDERERIFFHTALCAAVKNYYFIIQATHLGSKLFEQDIFTSFLPKPDLYRFKNFNLDIFLISTMMYAVAVIITYSSGIAAYLLVAIIGRIAYYLRFRAIIIYTVKVLNIFGLAASVLKYSPAIVSASLISLAITTSGALSMWIGAFLYFIKISYMYEIHLKEVRYYATSYNEHKRKQKLRLRRMEEEYHASLFGIDRTSEEQSEETQKGDTEQTVEEPVRELSEEPSGESTEEEPIEDIIREHTEEPITEPTEEHAEELVREPTEKPTEELVREPTEKPTEEPAGEPTEHIVPNQPFGEEESKRVKELATKVHRMFPSNPELRHCHRCEERLQAQDYFEYLRSPGSSGSIEFFTCVNSRDFGRIRERIGPDSPYESMHNPSGSNNRYGFRQNFTPHGSFGFRQNPTPEDFIEFQRNFSPQEFFALNRSFRSHHNIGSHENTEFRQSFGSHENAALRQNVGSHENVGSPENAAPQENLGPHEDVAHNRHKDHTSFRNPYRYRPKTYESIANYGINKMFGDDGEETPQTVNAAPGSQSEGEIVPSDYESDHSIDLSESDVRDAGLLWNLHFHVTIFLLWLLSSLLNTPSLFVWAKNTNTSVFLQKDPAILPSVILNICGYLLWQPGIPHPCRRIAKITSAALFILATSVIIYGTLTLYRLSYLISLGILVVTLHQAFAKIFY